MSKANILIVEDKFIVAQDISMSVRKLGYTVASMASSGTEAIEKARTSHPDLILMDIHLKGELDGVDVAAKLQGELNIPVIYLTAHSDQATLERASLTDPCGYLLKPYDERQLYSTIELALNRSRTMRSTFLKQNPDVLPHDQCPKETNPSEAESEGMESVRGRAEFSNIVGSCPTMLRLLHNVELVAQTDVTVHIYGENGTGKELVADALHQLSPRHEKPFIKLNCSVIPAALLESALFGHTKGAFTGANKDQEGFIERADGGTLFLDEIGDVSHDIQVKLLRLLQNREYMRVGETITRKADLRIVTATNRDLKELVSKGKIREDFFYRIHVFPLAVPALRERGEDVLVIAEHFRTLFNKLYNKNVLGFSDAAQDALLEYSWPGNVRELENAVRRAFVLIGEQKIDFDHLPVEVQQSRGKGLVPNVVASPPDLGGEDERREILEALERSDGNKSKAAELLGYSRVTLWKKLNKLGIEA